MSTQPNHLNWIPVDPNNLPDGEVLALILETKMIFPGELVDYHDSDGIVCKYKGGYVYHITHYIPKSEIPMPGEAQEIDEITIVEGDGYAKLPEDYVLIKGLAIATPSLDELKARAQEVADRFNKKYGLETMRLYKLLGIEVCGYAHTVIEDDPNDKYQVYVRIPDSRPGMSFWHYIYCADTDSFIGRFQGCLDD